MKDKPNKFAVVLQSHKADAEEPPQSPQSAPEPTAPRKAKPANTPKKPVLAAGKGKRTNPEFAQVTAYIPAKLHTDTKIALLRLPEKKEFSELVEELLVVWNKKQQ